MGFTVNRIKAHNILIINWINYNLAIVYQRNKIILKLKIFAKILKWIILLIINNILIYKIKMSYY